MTGNADLEDLSSSVSSSAFSTNGRVVGIDFCVGWQDHNFRGSLGYIDIFVIVWPDGFSHRVDMAWGNNGQLVRLES